MNESRDSLQGNNINEKLESLNLNSNNNNSHKKEDSTNNAHDKAYKYLESLEKKYPHDLDNMYEKTRSLMEIVREEADFNTGLKKAIEEYKILKNNDKESFILIQFLETFYEGFTTDQIYYTKEMHETNFHIAFELAKSALGDQHQLLGDIYSVNSNDIA